MKAPTNETLSKDEGSLSEALKAYEQTIATLETAEPFPSPEQILEAIVCRRKLQDVLDALSTRQRSRRRVDLLDARLDRQAERISQKINLKDWQVFLEPEDQEWLLWFQTLGSSTETWHDRLDWLWQLVSILCFGISFTFLVDIIKRSITGGLDIGAAGATISAILISLVSGGGSLTQFGRHKTESLFVRWKIPKEWWDEARCLLSLGFLSILIGFWFLLPSFSDFYIKAADNANNLARKEDYFERAIALKPDSLAAHLGLARLFVEQQDYDNALAKFKASYTNIAKNQPEVASPIAAEISRLFLDRGDYSKADRWLQKSIGLNRQSSLQFTLTENQFGLVKALGRKYLMELQKPLEAIRWFQLGKEGTTNYLFLDWVNFRTGDERPVKYYEMLTSLAWAQLKAGLLSEAQSNLFAAFDVEQRWQLTKKPSAFCIKAQVWESLLVQGKAQAITGEQINADRIRSQWEQCAGRARLDEVDGALWNSMASEHLNPSKEPRL